MSNKSPSCRGASPPQAECSDRPTSSSLIPGTVGAPHVSEPHLGPCWSPAMPRGALFPAPLGLTALPLGTCFLLPRLLLCLLLGGRGTGLPSPRRGAPISGPEMTRLAGSLLHPPLCVFAVQQPFPIPVFAESPQQAVLRAPEGAECRPRRNSHRPVASGDHTPRQLCLLSQISLET